MNIIAVLSDKVSLIFIYLLSSRNNFVSEFRYKYGVKTICRFLKINESGYYCWLRNQSEPDAYQLLRVKIQGILSEHQDNKNYAVRRIMSKVRLIHKRRKPHDITKVDTAT